MNRIVLLLGGSDFRPEYSRLGVIRTLFKKVPIVALTATADTNTKKDIINILSLEDADIYTHNFDRPNLEYIVYNKTGNLSQLTQIINKHPKGTKGLIYCSSRKRTEELALELKSIGINAEAFHAGLKVKDKTIDIFDKNENVIGSYLVKGKDTIQKEFTENKIDVVVCTVAFGMGVDIPNIRYVIYDSLAASIEELIQGNGRASRDGEPAQCYLLYRSRDVRIVKFIIEKSTWNPERLIINNKKLDQVVKYAETTKCLRQYLLNHFDQKSDPCGNCSSCKRAGIKKK